MIYWRKWDLEEYTYAGFSVKHNLGVYVVKIGTLISEGPKLMRAELKGQSPNQIQLLPDL